MEAQEQEKLQFVKLIEPDRYTFVESENNSGEKILGIRLEDLEYKGLIYEYTGRISFGQQETPEDNVSVSYNINIFTYGEAPEDVQNKPEFKKLLGDILMDLIAMRLEQDPNSIQYVEPLKS